MVNFLIGISQVINMCYIHWKVCWHFDVEIDKWNKHVLNTVVYNHPGYVWLNWQIDQGNSPDTKAKYRKEVSPPPPPPPIQLSAPNGTWFIKAWLQRKTSVFSLTSVMFPNTISFCCSCQTGKFPLLTNMMAVGQFLHRTQLTAGSILLATITVQQNR